LTAVFIASSFVTIAILRGFAARSGRF